MSSKGTFGAAFALLSMGCSPANDLLAISAPEGTRYVAAVWSASGKALLSTGLFDLDSGATAFPLDPAVQASADEVALIAYDEASLSGLGPPDPNDSIREAIGFDPRLPTPTFEGSGPWSEDQSSIAFELRAARKWTVDWLPRCPQTACDVMPFEDPRIRVGIPDTVPAAVEVAYGSVFVLGVDGRLFRRELDETYRVVSSTASSGLDLAKTSDGRLFALLGAGLTEVSAEGRYGAWIPVLANQRMAASSEALFLSSGAGTLERFEDARVDLLFRPQDAPSSQGSADVGASPSGEARLALEDLGMVIDQDGRIDRFFLHPRLVGWVDGFGWVLTTAFPSQVHRHNGQDWEPLASDMESGFNAFRIWPVNPGFLTGGFGGTFFYFHPHFGSCGPFSFTPRRIRDMVAFEDEWLMFGDDGTLVALRRRSVPVPEVCL